MARASQHQASRVRHGWFVFTTTAPNDRRQHSALLALTGNGILARHRECAGGGPEDSMGVNEGEWATPSGPRRRRRL